MQNLTRDEISSIGLPKWPQIVVVGEKVTREQAHEILIRTDGLYFTCNDKAWEAFCRKAFEMPLDDDTYRTRPGETEDQRVTRVREFFAAEDRARKKFKPIRLNYLHNSRIATAYVGGPKGWIDWEGVVGCYTFNIGKWPSTEDVFEEWERITRAWPFLSLRCQLFNKEHCEEGGEPVIEYVVREGRVTAHRPETSLLAQASVAGSTYPNLEDAVKHIAYNVHRERGCSPGVLLNAITHTLVVVSRLPEELEDGQE